MTGQVSLEELQDSFVQRDDVQALIARVRIETGPDDDPAYPVGARFDTVSVLLKDGQRIDSEPVYRFRGHGENPMSEAELRAKFSSCTEPVIGNDASAALWQSLRRLGQLPGAGEIPKLKYPS